VLVAVACLSVLAGCGGNGTSTPAGNPPPVLKSIQVNPGTASVAAGVSQQFTATGKYSDGSSHDLTQSATWTSSDTTIAASSSGGMTNTKTPGTVIITATFSGVSGNATLTVDAAALTALAVSPASPSIASGTAVQFQAIGTFSDSSVQNVTAAVQWSTSDTTVVNINLNGAQGLALGVTPGTCTVTAVSGGVSGSATLTITNAVLVSIAVTPVNPSIPLGTLQQFTAIGTFSDSTTQDITNTVAWTSSNTNVASITISGVATARNLGATTIAATSGAVSGSSSATVDASDISSLAVGPGNPTIAQTTSQQFSATGTFNDGSTHDLTNQVVWTSSDTTVASIGKSNGLAKGLTPGNVTINAALGTLNASANLTVTNATITSIAVTPTGRTIPAGTKLGYTATGTFSDSTNQVITRDVTWASDSVSVATIGNSGIATAVAPGNANISATLNSVTGSTSLSVNSVTLTAISVTPTTAALAPASTMFYGATGTYSDGSTRAITNAVQWSSSATNVATITNSGQATGQSVGTATITALQGSVNGTAGLVVEPSVLTSVQITPGSATIAEQTSVHFKAIGTFADGNTQNLTNSAIWTASPSSVATVSVAPGSRGLASGIAPGTATITALFAGQVGTASLNVTNATLTSITVTPSSPNVSLGGSVQFAATGNFSDGSTQNLTSQVNWTSSNASVAAIDARGVASSVAAGTTTITASTLGVSGNAVLTVF
jgi:hypothetical protein